MDQESILKIQAQEQLMRSQLTQEQIAVMQKEAIEQQSVGMIKEQLDLKEEMKRIENLLRGKYMTTDSLGNETWVDSKTNENKMLTSAGIQFILNSISWYLNKNTLLSNYDEETISQKMEDYTESLNDALFLRSEIYFIKPTLEECHEILEARITQKIKKIIIYMEIKGIEGNETEIRKEITDELDVERELDKIRETQIKDKLKGFEHLIRVVQDTIHSCYNRAYHGGERTSIRKSMHVSESISPSSSPKRNQANPFNWFKR